MVPSNSATKRARTDRHNNPIAVTTAVCRESNLVAGKDYEEGDPFTVGNLTLYTARFLGDPIQLSLRVLDSATYFTHHGTPRWTYMCITPKLWKSFSDTQRKLTVAEHYQHESGTEMKGLFA